MTSSSSTKRSRSVPVIFIILIPLLIIAVCIAFGNARVSEPLLSDNINDSSINWSSYSSNNIELSGSVKITNGGVYTLSGVVEDGFIEVLTDRDVKLILNEVSITNSNGPAIYIANADNVIIETAAGTTNTLTDSSNYSGWNSDVCATIFSHDDLVLQGEGTLIVNANHEDGIVSKDDLKINSGTYVINAKDDGVRGRDSVYIVGGELTVTAGGDSLKASNSDEVAKGYILIDGGSMNLSAGDDGIHAESSIEINDGIIDVKKSYEGIEAAKITINGGNITVASSDDGFNAAGGNDQSSPNMQRYRESSSDYAIIVNGGDIYVNSQGDGLDSNGSLVINGGSVVVDGPSNNANGALDAESSVMYNGGSIVAVGAAGMAVAPDTSSTKKSISVFFESNYPAGTILIVKDIAGNTILEHTSVRIFRHATLSSESFVDDETYIIYINGAEYASVTLDAVTTQVGSGSEPNRPGWRR